MYFWFRVTLTKKASSLDNNHMAKIMTETNWNGHFHCEMSTVSIQVHLRYFFSLTEIHKLWKFCFNWIGLDKYDYENTSWRIFTIAIIYRQILWRIRKEKANAANLIASKCIDEFLNAADVQMVEFLKGMNEMDELRDSCVIWKIVSVSVCVCAFVKWFNCYFLLSMLCSPI